MVNKVLSSLNESKHKKQENPSKLPPKHKWKESQKITTAEHQPPNLVEIATHAVYKAGILFGLSKTKAAALAIPMGFIMIGVFTGSVMALPDPKSSTKSNKLSGNQNNPLFGATSEQLEQGFTYYLAEHFSSLLQYYYNQQSTNYDEKFTVLPTDEKKSSSKNADASSSSNVSPATQDEKTDLNELHVNDSKDEQALSTAQQQEASQLAEITELPVAELKPIVVEDDNVHLGARAEDSNNALASNAAPSKCNLVDVMADKANQQPRGTLDTNQELRNLKDNCGIVPGLIQKQPGDNVDWETLPPVTPVPVPVNGNNTFTDRVQIDVGATGSAIYPEGVEDSVVLDSIVNVQAGATANIPFTNSNVTNTWFKGEIGNQARVEFKENSNLKNVTVIGVHRTNFPPNGIASVDGLRVERSILERPPAVDGMRVYGLTIFGSVIGNCTNSIPVAMKNSQVSVQENANPEHVTVTKNVGDPSLFVDTTVDDSYVCLGGNLERATCATVQEKIEEHNGETLRLRVNGEDCDTVQITASSTVSPQPQSPSSSLSVSPQPQSPSSSLSASPQPQSPSSSLSASPQPQSPSSSLSASPQPQSPSSSLSASPQPQSPSSSLSASPQPQFPSSTPSTFQTVSPWPSNPGFSNATLTATPRAESTQTNAGYSGGDTSVIHNSATTDNGETSNDNSNSDSGWGAGAKTAAAVGLALGAGALTGLACILCSVCGVSPCCCKKKKEKIYALPPVKWEREEYFEVSQKRKDEIDQLTAETRAKLAADGELEEVPLTSEAKKDLESRFPSPKYGAISNQSAVQPGKKVESKKSGAGNLFKFWLLKRGSAQEDTSELRQRSPAPSPDTFDSSNSFSPSTKAQLQAEAGLVQPLDIGAAQTAVGASSVSAAGRHPIFDASEGSRGHSILTFFDSEDGNKDDLGISHSTESLNTKNRSRSPSPSRRSE
jgi:hypothetical protein